MINKPKTECETKLCQYDSLTRTRFYNGMLLTAEHLRAEQTYHRESLKRLNRNLFGSGIVCGLEVETQPRGLCLTIKPGVALDCCGNLIEVCKCITVDLTKLCKEEYGSKCLTPPEDPQKEEEKIITKWLVLRYAERETDPEQVFTPGDECKPAGEKTNCEASKVREGFCIELWDQCPCPENFPEPTESLFDVLKKRRKPAATPSTSAPINQPESAANLRETTGQPVLAPQAGQFADARKDCIDLPLPCLSCCCCEDSNAVGLARLEINCALSTVSIVECDCRRYVISPRLLVWLFSRFPLRQYIPKKMDEVYRSLGNLPIAQMMGTAIGFEERGDTLREHEKFITAHRNQVDDHERRITALETPPGDVVEGQTPVKRGAKKSSSAETAKDEGKVE